MPGLIEHKTRIKIEPTPTRKAMVTLNSSQHCCCTLAAPKPAMDSALFFRGITAHLLVQPLHAQSTVM